MMVSIFVFQMSAESTKLVGEEGSLAPPTRGRPRPRPREGTTSPTAAPRGRPSTSAADPSQSFEGFGEMHPL